jgi:hypothetical protein
MQKARTELDWGKCTGDYRPKAGSRQLEMGARTARSVAWRMGAAWRAWLIGVRSSKAVGLRRILQ